MFLTLYLYEAEKGGHLRDIVFQFFFKFLKVKIFFKIMFQFIYLFIQKLSDFDNVEWFFHYPTWVGFACLPLYHIKTEVKIIPVYYNDTNLLKTIMNA